MFFAWPFSLIQSDGIQATWTFSLHHSPGILGPWGFPISNMMDHIRIVAPGRSLHLFNLTIVPNGLPTRIGSDNGILDRPEK